MVYVDDSTLLITKYNSYCMETLSFPDSSVTTYLGFCSESGNSYVGHRLTIRVGTVFGVAYDGTDNVFYTIYGMKKILAISVMTNQSSIFMDLDKSPRNLMFDLNSQTLQLTTAKGFARIFIGNASLQAWGRQGSYVGTLETTQFDSPRDLAQISETNWVICDERNDRFVGNIAPRKLFSLVITFN